MIPNLVTISDCQTHPYFVPVDEEIGNQKFDDAVTVIQKKVLIDLLGQAEYSKFVQDYSGSGLVWNTQKWIDFVDGQSYQVSGVASTGITIEWSGVKDTLKYFCYIGWLASAGKYYSETGGQFMKVENATSLNITQNKDDVSELSIDAYGVDWSCMFHSYNCNLPFWRNSQIRLQKYYEPYYVRINKDYIENLKLANTAYNFLYYYNQRENAFPDWKFTIKRQSLIGL